MSKRPQDNYREAIPLLERALSICKKLGESHPVRVSAQSNLERIRQKVRLQLGRFAGKPGTQRIARKPGTDGNNPVPYCRCEDQIEAAACDFGYSKRDEHHGDLDAEHTCHFMSFLLTAWSVYGSLSLSFRAMRFFCVVPDVKFFIVGFCMY